MMDFGRKTLILLTLCALAGAKRSQELTNNLEILVSVPSTHIGDTEIVSSIINIRSGHPLMHTVFAQKNQTRCVNSTDPVCPSTIREPALDVSMSSRGSNGKTFTFSKSFNRSKAFVINVGREVTVSPPQEVLDESDGITVVLDIMYNQNITSRRSFRTNREPTLLTLNAEFITQTIEEDEGEDEDEDKGTENGQSTLCSAPLCTLIVLALLPVVLLK